MYRSILVPLDAEGRGPLTYGRDLAGELGCPLVLVQIHHHQEAPEDLEMFTQYRFQNVMETWDSRDVDTEREESGWLAARARELATELAPVPVSSRVVHSPLTELADDLEGALVVMQADQELSDPVPPVARELMGRPGTTVLLVPPGSHVPARRAWTHILCPVDGSPLSFDAVEHAVHAARETDARITLLEVVTPGGVLRRLFGADAEERAAAARAFLDGARRTIPPAFGPVECRVVEADRPAEAILEHARREGVDLIVTVTHGRSGLRRTLLGSVAERVVERSPVPVLMVRPHPVGSAGPARV